MRTREQNHTNNSNRRIYWFVRKNVPQSEYRARNLANNRRRRRRKKTRCNVHTPEQGEKKQTRSSIYRWDERVQAFLWFQLPCIFRFNKTGLYWTSCKTMQLYHRASAIHWENKWKRKNNNNNCNCNCNCKRRRRRQDYSKSVVFDSHVIMQKVLFWMQTDIWCDWSAVLKEMNRVGFAFELSCTWPFLQRQQECYGLHWIRAQWNLRTKINQKDSNLTNFRVNKVIYLFQFVEFQIFHILLRFQRFQTFSERFK